MKIDNDLINLKDYIDKIKEVINRIFNIIKKYNYSLKEEERIVRINELYRYDSRLLRQTLREPKFFKKINHDLKPEYLYSYDLIDNIDTYENRFIKYLINLIKRNLVIILKTFKPLNISQILNGKLSFTYYGNYKNLSYLNNDNDISDIYNELEDINHKINLIMKTNYYKHINNVIFNEVIVTNLLNDDSNYNYCYRFYLIKNNYYPNFINKLINDLRLNTNIIKDVKTIKNGEFKNFICSYNGFILTLNSDTNMNATLLFLGLGTQEIVIIAIVVLLLFGGKKIPELMKGLGKGVKSFKDGVNGIEESINESIDKAGTPNEEQKK